MKLTRRGFLKRAAVVAGAVALPTPVAAQPELEPSTAPLVITSPWGAIPPRTVSGLDHGTTMSTSSVMRLSTSMPGNLGYLLHPRPVYLTEDWQYDRGRSAGGTRPGNGSWAEFERRMRERS